MGFRVGISSVIWMSLVIAACGQPVELNGAKTGTGNSGGNGVSSSNTNTSSDSFSSAISANDEYDYLNKLRQSAGMSTLTGNTVLAQSSLNHANYLLANKIFGHEEYSGNNGFTGSFAGDRAIAAGYRTTAVGEGIANGSSKFDAIDKLMSAIYHRYTLFNFEFNTIGMGYASNANENVLVHNMSNSYLNDACASNASIIAGNYYDVCKPVIRLSAAIYDTSLNTVINSNPHVVTWPPSNGTDIPPVFFEETPDPLPDYSVSGYPISVQFNPLKNGTIVVNSFYLTESSTGTQVTSTRLLDKSTDPNKNFEATEFALFPLQRLEWGTKYRVVVQYTNNGVANSLDWTFTTRQLKDAVKRITYNDANATITNNATTNLYFVPSNGNDIISVFRSEYIQGRNVSTEFVDNNTLKVTYSGNTGDTLRLTLNDTRVFTLTVN